MTRHLAIGDIYGCNTALRTLCEFVDLRSDDTIITLGDYPNRRPDTKAVIDWLIHLSHTCKLRPLRGNHDIMMLNAHKNVDEFEKFIEVGGDRTLRSYARVEGDGGSLSDVPDSHWKFLDELLHTSKPNIIFSCTPAPIRTCH